MTTCLLQLNSIQGLFTLSLILGILRITKVQFRHKIALSTDCANAPVAQMPLETTASPLIGTHQLGYSAAERGRINRPSGECPVQPFAWWSYSRSRKWTERDVRWR